MNVAMRINQNGNVNIKGRIEELRAFDSSGMIDTYRLLDTEHKFNTEEDWTELIKYFFGFEVGGYVPADRLQILSDGRIITSGLIEEGNALRFNNDYSMTTHGEFKEDDING